MRYVVHGLVFVVLFALGAVAGDIVVDGKFKSTQSSGPPLDVASTDMVANLNADMVDGVEGTNLYTKDEVDALVAAVTDACTSRQYYLTNAEYATTEVHTACASGFHFASLYEIVDVSNLKYARYHPDAYFQQDSGLGPPTEVKGWIRTGYALNSDLTLGRANCDLWTSTSGSDYGSMAFLSDQWDTLGIGWRPWSGYCSFESRVWCVEE